MNAPIPTRHKEPFEPAQHYRAALADYLASRGDAALGRAYEIGRCSLESGISLVEISSIHHASLAEILQGATLDPAVPTALDAASEFLANALSPYEMAHRGFQDALAALRQMNETLEERIRHIAHAVHDEAGQLLVYVHLALAEISRGASRAQQEAFDRISELLKDVEGQLRQYSHELRPPVLDDLGLVPAIRFLADSVSKRSGLPIRVVAENAVRLEGPAEIALYRVIQEALNNVTKHSKAGSVRIFLRSLNSTFQCTIEDDGVGFDLAVLQTPGSRKGLGLIGMRERISALGGTFQIASSPRSGTRILLDLPNSPKEKPDAH